MSDDRYAPIFDKIAEFVKALAPKDTHEDIDAAKASVLDEFDVFVRSGNRTDYRRDELAATSGKMEKLIDGRDGWAHTYSTMKGRRVDDVLYTCLNHISTFVFPPTAREDKKKDGSPKMTSRAAERERWIQSLGYTKAEVGKGKRNLFGDSFEALKTELEGLIPERFEGTEIPKTAKQLLALIAPAALGAEIIRINVYKPGHEGNTNSLLTLVKFLLAGYRFQTDKEGRVVGELAQFYSNLADTKITEIKQAEQAALEAQLKQDAEKEAAA